jgi:hypothetical protein
MPAVKSVLIHGIVCMYLLDWMNNLVTKRVDQSVKYISKIF